MGFPVIPWGAEKLVRAEYWCPYGTVEPRYNEDLGTMEIALLYQVSPYIRVKKKTYKELGPAKLPCFNRVSLCPNSL